MARLEHFSVGATPDPYVAGGASHYTQQQGLYRPSTAVHDFSHVVMPQSRSAQIGHAYDALPSDDPAAHPAYAKFREETKQQYDFVTRPRSQGGMGIEIAVTKEDPYGNGPKGVHGVVNEVRDDVVNNNRIKVLSTQSTGGHPFLSNDENDMFRGVHDLFGHLGSGRGVDMHGEEAAFQKHGQMFSPLARQAMATETRGQNSSLHINGDFPEQKVALLPPHMQSPQFTQAPIGEYHQAVGQARAENRKQGL